MSDQIAMDPPNSKLPLFYTQVEVLDAAVHAGMSLKENIGYGFARNTNFIQLIATELFAAASHYPIVFTTDPVPSILAVVGLRESDNLFVSHDGKSWDATYIPAYVRRYPFVFLDMARNDELGLCIDAAAGALTQGDVRPLFEAGELGAATRHALNFCIEFQRSHIATEACMLALMAQDLLIPYQVTSTLESGEQLAATGFKVVDEARLARLPDDVVLEWHKQGWLGLVHAHLASAGCWAQLAKRVSEAPQLRLAA